MTYHGIDIPQKRIAEFCRRNHIRRLALYGSILRGDLGPNSDVDVLVEFEPDQTPGRRFSGLQQELTELLNRKVDLSTPQCLSKYFRNQVLQEARVLYDAA